MVMRQRRGVTRILDRRMRGFAVAAHAEAPFGIHELARFAGASAGGGRKPVRGAGRPALGCRAGPAARPAAAPAAVVRRMRRAHPDGRLLWRRAEPLPALQAGGWRAAAQPQPRKPAPPAWRSCAAGEHCWPGGPAQSPPGAPQRCARCHPRPGPGPGLCAPVMTIPDGERTLPQYAPQGRCRIGGCEAARNGGPVRVIAVPSALGPGVSCFTTVAAGLFALRVFRCPSRHTASRFPWDRRCPRHLT